MTLRPTARSGCRAALDDWAAALADSEACITLRPD
jgi:hypothetical protein